MKALWLLAPAAMLVIAFNNCSTGFQALDATGYKLLASSGQESVTIKFDSASTVLTANLRETFQILTTGPAEIVSVKCQLNSEPETDCASRSVSYDGLTATDYVLKITVKTASGLIASESRTYHKDAVPSIAEPAWMKGKALNEWFQIPNTAGNGGSAVCAFSGMALKETTSEILIAAAGGHGDSSDNRVVSLRLDQDAPAWVLRGAPSTTVQPDVAYYSDAKPSSRHTYYTTHYIPSQDRVMLIGAQFVYGRAVQFPTVDGFSLSTNTWDAAGKWKDIITYGKAFNKTTGEVWTAYGYGVFRWSPTLGQQQVGTLGGNAFMAMQNSWDTKRNQLASIGFGDGWGYGNYPALNAFVIDSTGKTITPITFNPSAGLTQFLAERPISASFEYDADNDRYLYFGGNIDGGRIFVIKPNVPGTPWDVSVLALGNGTKNPSVTTDAGVMSRFRYVPNLKGFAYLHCGKTNTPSDVYFIRTAY